MATFSLFWSNFSQKLPINSNLLSTFYTSMAPLEARLEHAIYHEPPPETFVPVLDHPKTYHNVHVTTNHTNTNPHFDFAVESRRDVIIGTNPLYDYHLNEEQRKKNDWIEMFSYLCVCVPTNTQHNVNQQDPKVAVATRKNIVYPVARYGARLNSPALVQQRRKRLEPYFTFRPLHAE
jgi:hypothetical protein